MQKLNFQSFVDRIGASTVELNKILRFLPPLGQDGPWLAGGAIRRVISFDSLDSDFDFFFKSEQQLKNFVAALEEPRGLKKIISKKENENNIQFVISFFSGDIGKDGEWFDVTIQCIKLRYYNSLEEVLDSFDFTICQFGYDGTNLVCGDLSLYDLARKRIVIHNLTFPVASLRRLIKYTKQGFYACNGCLNDFLNKTVTKPELLQNNMKYID